MISQDVQKCVDELVDGNLVAFPTETVFGLGARADSPDAVAKIFEAKNRPSTHPLISHCADIGQALSVGSKVPQYARILAEAFWPGPMTLILNCENDDLISSDARGGHDSVAVRVPSHPKALELLRGCGFFVAAPSANKFGRVSPTTAEHVNDEFGDELLVLDGGQSIVGVESTIISCLDKQPQVLRTGKITEEDILRVTEIEPIKDRANPVAASGTLENHYAPSVPLYLFENESEIVAKENINPQNCAFLSMYEPSLVFSIFSTPKDVNAYAHELYAFFRKAEIEKCEAICAIAPPMIGIGVAVNDRLKRAANAFIEKNNG